MECRSRAGRRQFESLLEHMERHGDIDTIRRGPWGRVKTQKLWKELANSLNSVVGGVHRTPDTWRKVWINTRNSTKKKAALMKRQARRGNPTIKLTDLERRILWIINMPTVSNECPDEPPNLVPTTSATAALRSLSQPSISSSTTDYSIVPVVPVTLSGSLPSTSNGSPPGSGPGSPAVSDSGSDNASEISTALKSTLPLIKTLKPMDMKFLMHSMNELVCPLAEQGGLPRIPDVRKVCTRGSDCRHTSTRLESQTPTVQPRLPDEEINEVLTFDRADNYMIIEKRRLKLYLMRERNETRRLEIEGERIAACNKLIALARQIRE